MSSLTTNLKLVKPELQDNITPTIFADNFDKIDAALEGVSGGALSLEEIEASTNLDGKIPSAAALKEVNNSIQDIKIFPDTTRILASAIDNGVTLNYTATEDCYATITVVGNSSISITLNGVKILQPGTVSNVSPSAISLFLKKGDNIKSSNSVRYCIMGLR